MRHAFFDALLTAAERDSRLVLIVGDLGFNAVESFAARFPERFLNVGVAEQNLAGIAAGMALTGNIVFAYSIANFPTLRCLEQVRNDIVYHGANVKIVTSGGGLSYGPLGMSHHVTEDLAIMRALPGMTVVAPGDPFEAAAATLAVAAYDGPCYVRLGRSGEPRVHQTAPPYELGRALTVRTGCDATIIATGGMLYTAAQASDFLRRDGIHVRVLSMHTVRPLDVDAVLAAARETGAVFTLEEHSIVGGLGGAAAEVLAESGELAVPFRRLALPSSFVRRAGTQAHLLAESGLTAAAIADNVARVVSGVRL